MQPGRERIAISERLMKQAKTESEDEVYLWNHLEIAVNGWANDGASHPVYDELHVHYQDVYKRLAGLIDQVCHVVPFDGNSLSHCSNCGHPILKPWPNFCPCCGARIELNGEGRPRLMDSMHADPVLCGSCMMLHSQELVDGHKRRGWCSEYGCWTDLGKPTACPRYRKRGGK